jgi:hypothetical protein
MSVLAAKGIHQIWLRSDSGQSLAGDWVSGQFQFSTQADPGTAFRPIALADFDANGLTDLVYQNITQPDAGDVRVMGDFLPAKDFLLRPVRRVWEIQAIGDLDGDGFDDLVWRYTLSGTADTGVSYVWFSNGTAVTEVRKRGGAPLSWTLLGAADLDGDGAADMIYLNPQGQFRALMATTGRTCANLAAGTLPPGFSAIRVGDFSGRGRGDVLLRNSVTGEISLLQLDGSALTLPAPTALPGDPNAACTSSSLAIDSSVNALPSTPPTWQYYGSGDFNRDGVLDIVWVQPNGTLTVWLMNRNGAAPTVVSNAGQAPAGYSVIQAR